jgi:hypothetical protein
MLSGLTASDMLAGTGGGGVPILNVALLFSEPVFALMST